jgi:hypothetical protein
MPSVFPTSLDSWVAKIDGDAGDEIVAAHVNKLQEAMAAVQAKMGKDGSAVTTSIDYLLKNTASLDPGHKHSNTSLNSIAHSKLSYSGLTAGQALIASGPTAAAFRAIVESDIGDEGIFTRAGDTESISGQWTFQNVMSLLFGATFFSAGGSGSITLRAPDGQSGVRVYRLPILDGSNGDVLATDGSGNLTFVTAGGDVSGPGNGNSVAGALAKFTDTTGTVLDDVELFSSFASPNQGLQLGGVTSSFPAIRRSGAKLQTVLADASTHADHEMAVLYATAGVLGASGDWGAAAAGEWRWYGAASVLKQIISPSLHKFASDLQILWSPSTDASFTPDIGIRREPAASPIAVRLAIGSGSQDQPLQVGQLILKNGAGGYGVRIIPPLNAQLDLVLPSVLGTPGQVLAMGSFGALEFVNQSGGGGTPAGSNKQIQYNASGAFGADPGLTFDPATGVLDFGISGITTARVGVTGDTGSALTEKDGLWVRSNTSTGKRAIKAVATGNSWGVDIEASGGVALQVAQFGASYAGYFERTAAGTTPVVAVSQAHGSDTQPALKVSAGAAGQILSCYGSFVERFRWMPPGQLEWREMSTPSSLPPSNYWQFYFKADGPYFRDDFGNESKISTGGGGSGTPGGVDTQVQFNDGGSFGADLGLTYDKTSKILSLQGRSGGGRFRQRVIELTKSGLSGASATITNALPAHCLVLDIGYDVEATVTGCTGWDLGVSGALRAFGDNEPVAVNTRANDKGTADFLKIRAATDLIFTPRGGTFTGGTINLSVTVILYEAPTT